MGIMELVMILLVAILVVGPEKLPEYARQFGRYYREFKKITSGATSEMSKALGLDEDEGMKDLTDELKSMRDDMSSLRKSLNEDADELKEAVASEAKQMRESVSEETGEIFSELEVEAKEISKGIGKSLTEAGDQLKQEAGELKESLKEDAAQIAGSLSESGRAIEKGLKQEVEDLQDVITALATEPEVTPVADSATSEPIDMEPKTADVVTDKPEPAPKPDTIPDTSLEAEKPKPVVNSSPSTASKAIPDDASSNAGAVNKISGTQPKAMDAATDKPKSAPKPSTSPRKPKAVGKPKPKTTAKPKPAADPDHPKDNPTEVNDGQG
jgi:sec-independent protein translocase protein TatB